MRLLDRAEALAFVAAACLAPLLPWLFALPEDGLAQTARWLPFGAVACWWIARRVECPGVTLRRLASGTAGWCALATSVTQGGLTWGSHLAIAVLYALLGSVVLVLWPRLRQTVGQSQPRRPPLVAFALPWIVYVLLMPWSTVQRPPDGDEPYYMLIAHSLAYDLDVDLSNNYAQNDSLHFLDRALEPQLGDPVDRDGSLYSRHNALLGVVLTLPYRLGGRPGVLLTMTLFGGLLAWWSLRFLRRIYPEPEFVPAVTTAWGLLALTPPLLLYGHQVWTEVPATLLLLVACDALLGRPRPSTTLRLGAAVLLLPFLKFRYALLSGMLLIGAARRRLDRTRLVLLGLGLLAVGGLIAGVNLHLFGGILKHYSVDELRLYERPLISYVRATLGLAFDGAFGLFAAAPLWILLLPALFDRTVRQNPALRQGLLLLAPYLLLVASRQEWFGGWSPPFRYALPALPFLALALVPVVRKVDSPSRRLLVSALGALTALLTLTWLVVPGWTYNLADGGNHLIDHLSRRTANDLRLLWPSYVRTAAAAWLWPPLVTLATLGLWYALPRRRGHRVEPTTVALSGLLAASALFLVAGARLPTGTIEFEDPHVQARAGSLYPDQWTPDRQRFRGGRTLRQGDSLLVPVIDRSESIDLALELRFIQNLPQATSLTIASGPRTLAQWTADQPDAWQRVLFEALPWVPDQPLILTVEPPPETESVNGILLDRAEIRWR